MLFAGSLALTQTTSGPTKDQRVIVDLAQRAAVRALNFNQGDITSLRAARHNFTPEGWKDFIKSMEGFLDDKGAPKFSSEFVASRNAAVVRQTNGIVAL